MKHFISAAVLVCLAVPASAAETCRSFSGAIQLLPDPDCNIVQAYPGNAYLPHCRCQIPASAPSLRGLARVAPA